MKLTNGSIYTILRSILLRSTILSLLLSILPSLVFSAAGKDFVPPTSLLMPFAIGQQRSCIRVGIIDDREHEETEVFLLRMDTESSLMPQEVVVGVTNLSRLSIMDNDSEITHAVSTVGCTYDTHVNCRVYV